MARNEKVAFRPKDICVQYGGQIRALADKIRRIDPGYMTENEKDKCVYAMRQIDDAISEVMQGIKSTEYTPIATNPSLSEEFARHMYRGKEALVKAERAVHTMCDCMEDDELIHPYNHVDTDISKYFNAKFFLEETKYGMHFTLNQALPNMKTLGNLLLSYKTELEEEFEEWIAHWLEMTGRSRIPKMENAYMVFVHHYDKSKRYTIRDCDNYYEKPLSDILARCLMLHGDNCSYVQRCSFTESDNAVYTEVFLVRYNDFPRWVLEHEFNP